MSFPRKWIKEWLESAWIQELVNGSPCNEFQMQKGVHQRDPLSPFMFIIADEGLNWLFKKSLMEGTLSGLSMTDEGPVITHLQFTDNTLVFCLASNEEVQVIKKLLGDFEEIFGLRINYHKTILSGVGVSDSEFQILA